jgi:hypothetical protein
MAVLGGREAVVVAARRRRVPARSGWSEGGALLAGCGQLALAHRATTDGFQVTRSPDRMGG